MKENSASKQDTVETITTILQMVVSFVMKDETTHWLHVYPTKLVSKLRVNLTLEQLL
jgi:ribosomal protein S25